MIVQCENCQTKFNVNPDRINDDGSNVRCSNCKHVFKIFKPEAASAPLEKPVAPAPPIAPDQTAPPVIEKEEKQVSETEASSDDWDSEMDFGDLDGDADQDDLPGKDQTDELPTEDAGDDLNFGDLDADSSSEDGFDFGDIDEDLDFGASAQSDDQSPSMDDLGGDDLGAGFDFGDLDGDLNLGSPVEDGAQAPSTDDLGGDDFGGDFDFGDLDGDLDLGSPAEDGAQAPAMDDLGEDDLGAGFDFGDLDGDLDLGSPVEDGAPAPAVDDFGEENIGGDFDFGDFDGDLKLGSPDKTDTPDEVANFDMDLSDAGDQSGGNMDFGDFEDLTIGEPVQPTPEETLGIAAVSDDDELDFGNLGDDFDLGEPDTLIENHKPAPTEPDEDGGGLDDLDLKAAGEDFAGFAGEEVPEDGNELDFSSQFSDLGPDIEIESSSEKDPFSDLDLGDSAEMGMDDISPLDDLSPAGEGDDLIFFDGEGDETVTEPGKVALSGKKKKLQWILVGTCGFLALIGALFFIYPALLNPVLKPLGLSADSYDPAKDPDGNQYLALDKTTHYFKPNQYIGNILVVSGVVINKYSHPRSHIRVKGMLHSKAGENLLSAKQVYAGNWLSGEELETLPYEEMTERLRQKSGQNNTNLNVQPGDSIKFMIVFDQIPELLGSYTVEAFGSDTESSGQGE